MAEGRIGRKHTLDRILSMERLSPAGDNVGVYRVILEITGRKNPGRVLEIKASAYHVDGDRYMIVRPLRRRDGQEVFLPILARLVPAE